MITAPVMTVDDLVVAELESIMNEPGSVLTGMSSRANRARVPAPFPVHRWAEHLPAVVVLPRTAKQVSEIVKLANRLKIPVVPRAGGTGLNDGAVPLRGGILVDVKRMNQIHEIDLADRTVTVGPGINMLKLNEELQKYGVFYPDTPASYPCSLVGGRIACSGWSLLGSRFGHTRDLVISFEIVLPTGEIIRVGDGGGPKVRKSSTGYHLKQLFMGHQGTLGIVTEATLELVPQARGGVRRLLRLRRLPRRPQARCTGSSPPASPRWPARCSSTRRRSSTCGATTRRSSPCRAG